MAEFYGFFSQQGRYRLSFSTCIVDEFQGRAQLQQQLCARLQLVPGKLRADGLASVHEVSCTGLCDQGPALLVNGLPIPRLTPELIEAIADHILQGIPLERWPADWFSVL